MIKYVNPFLVYFILSLILLPSLVNSVSIGISPGYLDLSEIEPGESRIVRFYIVTSSDDLFLVSLSPVKSVGLGLFEREDYKNLLKFYSEQDPSPWVNFIENPIELLPPEEDYDSTGGGASLRGLREIKFVINVPKNAEPGYHIGEITMSPKIVHDDKSVSLVSVVPMKYIFKVTGNAVRDGQIIDVKSNGIHDGRLWLKVLYKNTGNVSVTIDGGEIDIFDKYGRYLMSTETSRGFVKPGETRELNSFADYDLFEEESYNVNAKISYLTGKAEKEGAIEIPEISEIPTGKVVEGEKETKFPIWLVILLIIVIVTLIIIFK